MHIHILPDGLPLDTKRKKILETSDFQLLATIIGSRLKFHRINTIYIAFDFSDLNRRQFALLSGFGVLAQGVEKSKNHSKADEEARGNTA